MKTTELIRSQARKFGLLIRLRGKTELKVLSSILRPGEEAVHSVYGYYAGGSGILVATRDRLLLVDKRPLYLHLEELDYGHIRESLLHHRFLHGTLHLRLGNKRLRFRTISDAHMKELYNFIESKRAIVARDIRDSVAAVDQVNLGMVPHPAWRPHAPHMIRRSKPVKFHRKLGRVASV